MEKETRKPFQIFITCIIVLFACFTLFILVYMFYNSLRTKSDFLGNTFGMPKSLSFKNYVKLFTDNKFPRYLFNSVFILVTSLILSIFLSSTVAYALGRYKFKFRNTFKVYFLIGLMFPVQLGVVPIFLVMKSLSIINTHLSVILICSAGISMSVFLLTDFFANLPNEIYEAAVVDGAGEFLTFYKIMMPLATPIIFSMSIVTAVQIWNQFYIPLIFLQSEDKKTIPLMVVKFTAKLLNTVDSALAVSVLSTVPIFILFVIFADKILDGVASGAVKG